MSFILVVDDEPEILEVMKMTLGMFTTVPVQTCLSGHSALRILDAGTLPLLIISDFRMPDGDGLFLYKKVMEFYPKVPFVVCSGNPIDELEGLFPAAHDILTKPSFIKPLRLLIERIFPSPEKAIYVKIPIAFLQGLGSVGVDVYVRLSDEKFVKVFSLGDLFTEEDVEKYQNKSLDHLYVKKDDATLLLKKFDSFVQKRQASRGQESLQANFDILNTANAFSRALGWTDETVSVAMKATESTIRTLSMDPPWRKILAKASNDSFHGHHISLLSILSCMVVSELGWGSDSTIQKLIMAVLMHDYYVDETTYQELHEGASDSSEILQSYSYRQHPIKAAELARSLKGLPSDVDHILLQHHERPDGSGFPRGLTAAHISPLSAVFIICEELIHYSVGREVSAEMITQFWEDNSFYVQREPFKKISLSLMSKI